VNGRSILKAGETSSKRIREVSKAQIDDETTKDEDNVTYRRG
jgi:hypothetical protein